MNIFNTFNKTTRGQQRPKLYQQGNDPQTEVVFAQTTTDKRTDQTTTNVMSYHCRQIGHYAKDSPKRRSYMNTTNTGNDHNEINKKSNKEHIFHQTGSEHLSKDWLLLDNQSALDQFTNDKYLTNIHTVKTYITAFCNVGNSSTNQKGKFGFFQCGTIQRGSPTLFSSKQSQIIAWLPTTVMTWGFYHTHTKWKD